MAILATGLPTLLDKVKRLDPDGSPAQIVELLTQKNPILQHATFQEGNLPTGHIYTSRTALPTVAWRRLNEGVDSSKSGTDQITETTGTMTGMSVVDVEVAKLNGNEAAFRASEDVAFLAAFNNEWSRALFYESAKTNPERMTGVAPRLNKLAGAAYTSQVISAAGAGADALTSIYLICWSPDSVFCIYPKGSVGGLEQQDMGVQLWQDAGTTKKFRAYVTQWTWKVGMVIKDYRQVVRIPNVLTTLAGIPADGSIGTTGDIIGLMIKAYYQIGDPNVGTMAWYLNRILAYALHIQARKAISSQITIETIDGKPVLKVMGVPVYVTDAIVGNLNGTAALGTSEARVA